MYIAMVNRLQQLKRKGRRKNDKEESQSGDSKAIDFQKRIFTYVTEQRISVFQNKGFPVELVTTLG